MGAGLEVVQLQRQPEGLFRVQARQGRLQAEVDHAAAQGPAVEQERRLGG